MLDRVIVDNVSDFEQTTKNIITTTNIILILFGILNQKLAHVELIDLSRVAQSAPSPQGLKSVTFLSQNLNPLLVGCGSQAGRIASVSWACDILFILSRSGRQALLVLVEARVGIEPTPNEWATW